MATKKDLVEAHSFSKRRLVTAFISGAPGGREVEPVRPGRVLIGGVAISLLLLAGAAIAGFLIGRPNSQWLEAGSFVTSKDTGEQYVVLEGGDDPVIRRVPNYISAQLLLGQSDLTPFQVRDKYIREVTLGEDLGIDDAPAGLPDPEGLIQDGWTACTAPDTGIQVAVDRTPAVNELTDSAFLVSSGGALSLIATDTEGPDGRAYRYELPANPTEAGTIAERLGFGAIDQAPKVSTDWLNLFRPGADLTLDAFGMANVGQPADYGSTVDTDLSRYQIGDMITTPNGGRYLLGDDGPQQLTEFAFTVYGAVGSAPQATEADVNAQFQSAAYPAAWPETLPTADPAPEMCAVLHPDADGGARVTLADDPTGDASSEGLSPGRKDVEVQPAGGAYVESGSLDSATDGTPYVIDSAGYKYELIGPEVSGFIGYGSTDAPVVPSAWMDFFEDKVELSVNLARRVPEDAPPADDAAEDS
ncbi:MAG: type VII secretion protein EccB [Nocardioides sp.]|uniref:type VII secretion protein EccB n=1 Tax=Nocardioides sp. TaxID=35761 RepID=UPI003264F930